MKKFLLMGCAALATLTVSAQKLAQPSVDVQGINLKSVVVKSAAERKPQISNLKGIAPVAKTFTPVKGNVAKAAPASLSGVFIEDYIADDFHKTDSVVIAPANAQDEEGNTYNTQLLFYCGSAFTPSTVYGQYDASTSTLTVPCGQVAQTNETYGEITIYAFSGNNYVENMTFDVSDNGILYLNEDGYQTIFTYNGSNYYYKNAESAQLVPQTGEITFQSRATGSWAEYTSAVAVVDNEYTLDVYNAFDLGSLNLYGTCISIDVNDDGSYSLPVAQNIYALSDLSSSADTDTYGEYLYLHGATTTYKEDGTVTASLDESVTSYTGQTTSDGSILFDVYLPTISKLDADGAAYGWWNYGMLITPSDPTGINNVAADQVKAHDSKTYNLAGQVVGKAYKGIVIKNGKKFIQK